MKSHSLVKSVLAVDIGIQVNLYIPEGDRFNKFNPNVTKDVIVPLAIATEQSVLTDDQADLWKYTIGWGYTYYQPISFWVFVSLSALALLCSVALGTWVWIDTRRRPTHDHAGYDVIY